MQVRKNIRFSRIFSLVIQDKPSTTYYCLAELERYEEALGCYDKALAIEPNYQEALDNKRNIVSKYKKVLYDKGNDLESSEKYEEAIKNYDRILEVTPNYAAAW